MEALIIITIVVTVLCGIAQGGELAKKLVDLRQRFQDWNRTKSKLRSGQASIEELEKWIEDGNKLASECETLVSANSKNKYPDMKEFVRMEQSILEDIRAYGSALAGAATSSSPSVLELARLRSAGMISNDEFNAFSERFEKSTGEKAQDIIKAIEDLNVQRKAGAMSEGNYRASLWTLMDRLDQSK